MKKAITASLLAAVALLGSGLAAHAQTKIGIVDMNKIASSYYKSKEAESRLVEARDSAQKEVQDKMADYKGKMEQVNKLELDIQKPELSKDAKETKTKEKGDLIAEIKVMEREIPDFTRSRERQLQEQLQRMKKGIFTEILDEVQKKVKAENFDLVLDKSGASASGVPVVLHSRDAADFSDEIITALNKNRPKDAGAAATPAKKP